MFDAKPFLKNLSTRPGVYRMLDAEGTIIYVGKAVNLKNRVSSYFRNTGLSPKTVAMVRQIASIEVTIVHTENEALLLENQLIKAHRPRYNIIFRDDKSYPYLYLSTDQQWPRLSFHRGARKGKGRYFGPYANSYAVREALQILQKLFRVRQCEDTFFKNRSRPCLQYQIDRCSAPCTEEVSAQDYAHSVKLTTLFLEGRNSEIIEQLASRMQRASDELDYEQAAVFRDQIANLRRVQEKQYVSSSSGDIDIVAARRKNNLVCVTVFFVRGGQSLGNKTFFPRAPAGSDLEEVLTAFIGQYYADRAAPSEVITSEPLGDKVLLGNVLSERADKTVQIKDSVRGERARWLKMAGNNADHALTARLASREGMARRVDALQQFFNLDNPPQRLECFDISHTMGEASVASCVVFDSEGPRKSDYRRFNIKDVTGGDDYAAIAQAVTRRYRRLRESDRPMPDIIFIDGGRGQLSAAFDALQELQVTEPLLVSVSKGSDRKAGQEKLFLPGESAPVILPEDSPALHLIQQIRDESHRFAISGHRARRARKRTASPLEQIPGMGPKRRQTLLKQFGGLQEVSRAGVEDLARVKGISKELAERIYNALHPDA